VSDTKQAITPEMDRHNGRLFVPGYLMVFKCGDGSNPSESRIIEMQLGRLVTLSWAYDLTQNRGLNNQVTFSSDYGHTWSAPLDTGFYVRLVDASKNGWQVKEETVIWGRAKRGPTRRRSPIIFGRPNLVSLRFCASTGTNFSPITGVWKTCNIKSRRTVWCFGHNLKWSQNCKISSRRKWNGGMAGFIF
jgi:hypothetical protein